MDDDDDLITDELNGSVGHQMEVILEIWWLNLNNYGSIIFRTLIYNDSLTVRNDNDRELVCL
jgi:hypothetical protein